MAMNWLRCVLHLKFFKKYFSRSQLLLKYWFPSRCFFKKQRVRVQFQKNVKLEIGLRTRIKCDIKMIFGSSNWRKLRVSDTQYRLFQLSQRTSLQSKHFSKMSHMFVSTKYFMMLIVRITVNLLQITLEYSLEANSIYLQFL